jgi:ribose transport system ATP-binding protein
VGTPTSAAPLRLQSTGLSKRYGTLQALSDVSVELRPGEVMALLGENGAGKSTFVKVLSGLVQPDSGSLTMDGAAVDLTTPARSQAAGVAVVQQEYSAVPTLTVAENLLLGRAGTGWLWTRRKLHDAAEPLLEQVGLGSIHPGTRVERLSVAETQLLEIARVLSQDARIVIFDEPTAALSDAEIDRVLGVVQRLASQGRSIVYVTHRLAEVFRISNRVTVFRNGRSLPAMDASGLDVDSVISMMLGRELGSMYPHRPDTPQDRTRLTVGSLQAPGLREPVSLTVRAGEILGLTGQLGSGASSFVQALAGTTHATGEVIVDDQPLSLRRRGDGIDAGVAYCSADRKKDGIFAGLTIQRNLSSPWLSRVSSAGVLSPKAERQVAGDTAAEFAIDRRRLSSLVGTLSGGNQQKVALGKWLGTDPKVLLVEEPTRGVDVGARAEIYTQLRRLCDAGLAIVVVSSDTAEIFGLADTIGAFYRGRLTALRPHTEWTEEALVRDVMHTADPALNSRDGSESQR